MLSFHLIYLCPTNNVQFYHLQHQVIGVIAIQTIVSSHNKALYGFGKVKSNTLQLKDNGNIWSKKTMQNIVHSDDL